MATLQENRIGYASPIQREILIQLARHPFFQRDFFLTGGTALSVFYLGHRVSEDLDLFSIDPLDLSEIDFWIKTQWVGQSVKIKESPTFLSFLIQEVKVDLVIDPLSAREEREILSFGNGSFLRVDTLNSIVTNKFCTIAGRLEPKDFIDFYFILKRFPELDIMDLYQQSRKKDGIFDDPPSVAYQIENGVAFIKENPSLWPQTHIPVDQQDFFEFYEKVSRWIYGLVTV
ncbi:MAG: nucleotidyl transferase AbiEii/AbiGii toxin family protein [Thermodesulfobacteriota bacterium]